MKVSISPFRPLHDMAFEVSKVGDVFTVNGVVLDFGPLADGAMLEPDAIDCEFIADPVRRVDGELALTILVPMPANPTPAQAFPPPLVDPPDGVLFALVLPSPEPAP